MHVIGWEFELLPVYTAPTQRLFIQCAPNVQETDFVKDITERTNTLPQWCPFHLWDQSCTIQTSCVELDRKNNQSWGGNLQQEASPQQGGQVFRYSGQHQMNRGNHPQGFLCREGKFVHSRVISFTKSGANPQERKDGSVPGVATGPGWTWCFHRSPLQSYRSHLKTGIFSKCWWTISQQGFIHRRVVDILPAKLEQVKSNHLQAGSSKSMCTPVS